MWYDPSGGATRTYARIASHGSLNFNEWLSSYKEFAFEEGISKKTLNDSFKNVKFLKQVIQYDRKQPEFYEDTNTLSLIHI